MNKEEYKNFSLAQANWWTAYANSKANKSRKVYIGNDSETVPLRLLTEEELVDDALNTAKQHLDGFLEMCNN